MTCNKKFKIIFKSNKTPKTKPETQRCNSLLEKNNRNLATSSENDITSIVAWGGQTDPREKLDFSIQLYILAFDNCA